MIYYAKNWTYIYSTKGSRYNINPRKQIKLITKYTQNYCRKVIIEVVEDHTEFLMTEDSFNSQFISLSEIRKQKILTLK